MLADHNRKRSLLKSKTRTAPTPALKAPTPKQPITLPYDRERVAHNRVFKAPEGPQPAYPPPPVEAQNRRPRQGVGSSCPPTTASGRFPPVLR